MLMPAMRRYAAISYATLITLLFIIFDDAA